MIQAGKLTSILLSNPDLLVFVGAEDVDRLRLSRNATYRSATSRDGMLEALYSVVNNRTKQLVANATFSAVLADESTDITNISQLVVHLRCVTSGTVTTRFGGIVALGRKDADSVREAMEGKGADLGVTWRKCHLGSDGASVFTGRHRGVAAQLIEAHDMEYSIAVHCVCHREALACADAVKAVTYLQDKVGIF